VDESPIGRLGFTTIEDDDESERPSYADRRAEHAQADRRT